MPPKSNHQNDSGNIKIYENMNYDKKKYKIWDWKNPMLKKNSD